MFFVISEWNVQNFETDISLSSLSKESPLSTQNEVAISYHLLWLLCILMMTFHLEFQKSKQPWRTCFLINHAAPSCLWRRRTLKGSLAVRGHRPKLVILFFHEVTFLRLQPVTIWCHLGCGGSWLIISLMKWQSCKNVHDIMKGNLHGLILFLRS